MTAEIAILNRTGVALAADSAVTIGSRMGQKVFNTANKLFSLSKYHPVGIMIYGNAEFMSVPWETIIKSYRSKLGTTQFPTLKEYVDDFLEYITTKTQFCTLVAEELHVRRVFGSHLNDVLSRVNRVLKHVFHSAEPTEEQVKNVLWVETALYREELSHHEDYIENGPDFISHFLDKHSETVSEVINEEIHFDVDNETLTNLLMISAYAFSKQVLIDNTSGVVFSGFGDDEIYPSLFQFDVEGITCNVLKYRLEDHTEIDAKKTASINPFAQQEMVHAFLGGIDPDFEDTILNGIGEALTNLSRLTQAALVSNNSPTTLTEEDIASIDGIGTNAFEYFKQKVSEYQRGRFIRPITSSVSILPKEELAAMAEALVNLTSFKRKVTITTETVGGPIDVAVISKGDGFIWIKRKHYFEPELNHHFFRNYLRGEQDD